VAKFSVAREVPEAVGDQVAAELVGRTSKATDAAITQAALTLLNITGCRAEARPQDVTVSTRRGSFQPGRTQWHVYPSG
jgi:hypothetical protein